MKNSTVSGKVEFGAAELTEYEILSVPPRSALAMTGKFCRRFGPPSTSFASFGVTPSPVAFDAQHHAQVDAQRIVRKDRIRQNAVGRARVGHEHAVLIERDGVAVRRASRRSCFPTIR